MRGLVRSAQLGLSVLDPLLQIQLAQQPPPSDLIVPLITSHKQQVDRHTLMADLASLEKARRELEDLYLGVPDESVNLTFQDFVEVSTQQQPPAAAATSDPHPSDNQKPSNRARSEPPNLPDNHRVNAMQDDKLIVHGRCHGTPDRGSRKVVGLARAKESRVIMGKSYDNKDGMSFVSGMSMSVAASPFQTGRRRRPGIPHSNICTLCTTYIYLFRHRCLVCGRVYCRQCVQIGMGEMAEGRKCVDCLGRRFSPRYIQIAGQTGCWMMGYSSTMKQQELKWAEKGPRVKKARNRSCRSNITSTSKSPTMAHSPPYTPSFLTLHSPYSPHTPTHHYPLPF